MRDFLTLEDGSQLTMNVLYVCADNIKGSTGYPRTTTKLRDWLFPAEGCTIDSIAYSLMKAFTYAVENPTARKTWDELFDDSSKEGGIVDTLKNFEITSENMVKEIRGFKPVVVVAIDEARGLFQIKNYRKKDMG
ncbi:hypothetical protein PHMEG_00040290 [Phytophthora megakarya]|uniref:Uncharacterized protein n=1 Tax=Phytophthora megakarya TaxID=4795 RepID=A0A225UE34_9STRA|nr:hypothetical protein PHMEG_00040290 [Phytophthora megakarya]